MRKVLLRSSQDVCGCRLGFVYSNSDVFLLIAPTSQTVNILHVWFVKLDSRSSSIGSTPLQAEGRSGIQEKWQMYVRLPRFRFFGVESVGGSRVSLENGQVVQLTRGELNAIFRKKYRFLANA